MSLFTLLDVVASSPDTGGFHTPRSMSTSGGIYHEEEPHSFSVEVRAGYIFRVTENGAGLGTRLRAGDKPS